MQNAPDPDLIKRVAACSSTWVMIREKRAHKKHDSNWNSWKVAWKKYWRLSCKVADLTRLWRLNTVLNAEKNESSPLESFSSLGAIICTWESVRASKQWSLNNCMYIKFTRDIQSVPAGSAVQHTEKWNLIAHLHFENTSIKHWEKCEILKLLKVSRCSN